MEYVIALVPALCFGIISPLVALIGGSLRQQVVGQMTGGFLVALVALTFITPTFTWQGGLISVLTGAMCAWGVTLQLLSFRLVGVSRTMPVSSGMQLSLTALGGVMLFNEWSNAAALSAGIAAIAVIVLGIAFTTYTERKKTRLPDSAVEYGLTAKTVSPQTMLLGLGINFISALLLAGYVVTMRASGQSFSQFMFPQSVGFVLGALVFAAFNPDSKAPLIARETVLQLIPGLLFGLGVVFMQTANRMVGVATGFTLSQMGVIISTLAGIFILHETKTRRELIASLLGVALVVVGAILIGVAKSAEIVG